MSAPDLVRVRLDGITERLAKITPGVWKLWGMQVLADQDGTSNVATAVPVAQTACRDGQGKPRTFDAQLIAAAPSDLAATTGALLAVVALAEKWQGWSVDDPSGFPAGYRAAAPFAAELRDTVAAHLDPGATT